MASLGTRYQRGEIPVKYGNEVIGWVESSDIDEAGIHVTFILDASKANTLNIADRSPMSFQFIKEGTDEGSN